MNYSFNYESLMKSINIEKINNLVCDFNKEREWEQFHSIKNLSMALAVESSELMELFQWMTEMDSENVKNDINLKSKLEDEISDVFIYLMRIAVKANVDIEQSILKKIEKNRSKYPIEKSKGNSKKYSDF